MFFIEVLSHASFFLIFLTIFYITFISYVQQQSMINTINSLFKDSTQTLVLVVPSAVISFFDKILTGSQTLVDPIISQVEAGIEESNKQVVTPFIVYGFTIAGIGILVSMVLAKYYGYSPMELFYTNLISIFIIAASEFTITSLYGQFRLIDSQYLSGLFALKASGGTPDCNVVGDMLNQMFPGLGLDKLI